MRQEEDELFFRTQQAGKKLELALKRYFELEGQKVSEKDSKDRELEQEYRAYLSFRLRPAAQRLIEKKENGKLERLLLEMKPDAVLLDCFLEKALEAENQEAQALLLRLKEEAGGFQEKQWEL